LPRLRGSPMIRAKDSMGPFVFHAVVLGDDVSSNLSTHQCGHGIDYSRNCPLSYPTLCKGQRISVDQLDCRKLSLGWFA
jgi:hypothetical protein